MYEKHKRICSYFLVAAFLYLCIFYVGRFIYLQYDFPLSAEERAGGRSVPYPDAVAHLTGGEILRSYYYEKSGTLMLKLRVTDENPGYHTISLSPESAVDETEMLHPVLYPSRWNVLTLKFNDISPTYLEQPLLLHIDRDGTYFAEYALSPAT